MFTDRALNVFFRTSKIKITNIEELVRANLKKKTCCMETERISELIFKNIKNLLNIHTIQKACL